MASAWAVNGASSEEEALARALAESAAMASTELPPLISTPLPLQNLAAEYSSGSRADLYSAKARHLEQRYAAIRRVRGDGNCFYYSALAGIDATSISHTAESVTIDDYSAQKQLRKAAVDWLLAPEQLPLCLKVRRAASPTPLALYVARSPLRPPLRC